ncbi:hypothetical protein HHK36_009658 [Tetracentron sinense]|uniref:DUF7026 domain-containing protein n=1 Tax=Tetracentron sinense TaxID=13715 RepID=A0A834ZBB1_TETSI|nr:hypothetical protein HHK36_009658 [Tetracentron sinense]
MAFRVPLISPKIFPQSLIVQNHSFPSVTPPKNRGKIRFSCTKGISDAELAADLAAKVNTPLGQRNEAMKKSRELLFVEFCQHLGLGAEEVKQKWKKMDEEQKWGLVKGFISEWGVTFHPLSSRSVKEMVEEHLDEEDPSPNSPSPMFPGTGYNTTLLSLREVGVVVD